MLLWESLKKEERKREKASSRSSIYWEFSTGERTRVSGSCTLQSFSRTALPRHLAYLLRWGENHANYKMIKIPVPVLYSMQRPASLVRFKISNTHNMSIDNIRSALLQKTIIPVNRMSDAPVTWRQPVPWQHQHLACGVFQ